LTATGIDVQLGEAAVAIDNALEKIRAITNEDDNELLSSLIQAGGLFSPVIAVLAAVKGVVDISEIKIRIGTAIRSLCDELERIRDRWPADAESVLKNSVWFKKAVQVLMEESLRAPSEERAVLLAKVAAHGCFPDPENKRRQEDLASYIRDLAQLGEDDVQMLRLLRDAYKEVFKNDPNLRDPNRFTQHNDSFKHAAEKLNIHPDDRLALGARLNGFGLAFEGVAQTEGHFFRPTRRGFYLLSLLEAAETPKAK
jgi:hypothetical protein